MMLGSFALGAQTSTAQMARAYLQTLPAAAPPVFDEPRREMLAAAGIGCVDRPQESPNNRNNYLWQYDKPPQLLEGYDRNRSFFGCSDWHDAVGSTWMLMSLLQQDPKIAVASSIKDVATTHFRKGNVDGDFAYLTAPPPAGAGDAMFEMPYGYSWLIKLYGETKGSSNADGKKLAVALTPLAKWMSERYVFYLYNLKFPLRTGVETNTAFAMGLALDGADMAEDTTLHTAIHANAIRLFEKDKSCATNFEPQNADLISPCLSEAALMGRVMEPMAYAKWLDVFLPPVYSRLFQGYAKDVDISHTNTAGPDLQVQLNWESHKIGLLFQRAAEMLAISYALPKDDERVAVFKRLAAMSAAHGYDKISAAGYEGQHWVPYFALLYENAAKGPAPLGPEKAGPEKAALEKAALEKAKADAEAATTAVAMQPAAPVARVDSDVKPTELAGAPRDATKLAAYLKTLPMATPPVFDEVQRLALAANPLGCEDHPHAASGPGTPTGRQAYLWQREGKPQILEDFDKHRAFYGCLDWHSSVNSMWMMVSLMKAAPSISLGPAIRNELDAHLQPSNIEGELDFFKGLKGPGADFERPYGYGWLLKLYGEARTWDDPEGKRVSTVLEPLKSWVAERYVSYLHSLDYPIRVGLHPNTALDMGFALDYAQQVHDATVQTAIHDTALRLFRNDQNCATNAEPVFGDFASPCLVEAAIMARVMDRPSYAAWLDSFFPPAYTEAFDVYGKDIDAVHGNNHDTTGTDEEGLPNAHLIGLNYQRATDLLTIAAGLPADDPRVPVYLRLANVSAKQGYDKIGAAGYLGTHWLATYALMYENERARTAATSAASPAAGSRQK